MRSKQYKALLSRTLGAEWSIIMVCAAVSLNSIDQTTECVRKLT
ncbi:hypothetical protein PC128_g6353 [Phytophthora cactorum]|nr:hypothetical protein PC128_g6353 [Phytophthora cactorum]